MALLQPARIRILAIGKLKRAWIAEGVAFYRKRLPGLEVVELKDSTPAKEADAIRAASNGSSGCGAWPLSTWQKAQLRVQIGPPSRKVAVPAA